MIQQNYIKSREKTVDARIEKLTKAMHQFLAEYRLHDSSEQITEAWTVKDILCHITALHMYYANNLVAEYKGQRFILAELDQAGVETMQSYSDAALTTYLSKAQDDIAMVAHSMRVTHMTMFQNLKPCTISQFLRIATEHMNDHTKSLKVVRFKHPERKGKGYL